MNFYWENNAARFGFFNSHYAHLDRVFVKAGQTVKRGDPIGAAYTHNDKAKLWGTEGGNFADPDYFGNNYEYMKYSDKQNIKDDEERLTVKNINALFINQQTALADFDNHRIDSDTRFMSDKWHKKRGHGSCQWSSPEIFKYLDTLYKLQPQQFSNLHSDEYEDIRKKFYDNQPFLLTLPLVKGGMKN